MNVFHKNALFYSALLILFSCFVFSAAAHTYETDAIRGAIQGTVTDSEGNPLAGVNIIFPQLDQGTSTDLDGSYRIDDLPSGTYVIFYSFVGFATHTERVSISDGSTTTLNVSLTQQSLQASAITITGTPYASDPLTTPDIDVLTGDEKFTVQQTSLGASLDDLAGISTISTGSNIGKPVIRGLSGNRIRVLDDGIAMDFQQYGVRHGPNVDPFTSERIEVVRGAASVQYGSDALGGAVNVISNRIPTAIDKESFLSGRLLGEHATVNNELSGGLHLDGASGGFGFTGTIVRRTAGNIQTPGIQNFQESGVDTDPKFTGELDNTDFDQLNASVGLGYRGNFGKITGEYTGWRNEHNFLLPNGRGLGQNLENDSFQIKGNLPLGNSFILKPQFSYLRNLRQSNPGGGNAVPRSELPDDGPAFLDILLDSYTGKVELENPSIGPFAGTIGLEYLVQDQTTRGTTEPLVPSGTINNFGFFVFQKAELGDFKLSVGARFDTRTQEAVANEQLNLPDASEGESSDVLDQSYTEFSGSVGGSYQFTEEFAIAANVGRGFRAPSLFDLHVDGVHGGVAAYQVGDPNLEPERSLNTDLSLRWRSSLLKAKVTGYVNSIDNYIFLVNTGEFAGNGDGPPILQSTQGNARLIGFDASMQAQLTPWMQVDGTFETVNGENLDDDIENVDKLPLLPATKLSGGIKLLQDDLGVFQDPYVRIGVEHVFEKEAAGRYEPFWQFGPAFPFGRASTDAYTLANASVGFKLALWNQPLSIRISAENLLDEAYRDFLDTYKGYALNPGRNINFRLKVPFSVL
ncbi:MAG: TonB-dependent receptor [Bacteroidetes bacterium]|jgi:iron complex outermembrane receptor protein/hemoglobin/transferrin/lactoferrin receptor protein|nr:TonB-dependent receptor [Bacteroidota bacterium]